MTLYRFEIRIEGFVQGIGFRPFIYKLALELGLKGWVNNDTEGVNVVIETTDSEYDEFVRRIYQDKPKLAEVKSLRSEKTWIDQREYQDFSIRESASTEAYGADVLPDLATCGACLNDISDPQNRRYQYAFTNCTHCGPRFSIIQNLPYDRQHTTMSDFIQCEDCQREYVNPLDRRFHAQPNACPRCGPQVYLHKNAETSLAEGITAIKQAADCLHQSSIVAIKGIGGYQLAVDATDQVAVEKLRQRKARQRKPFAVMMRDLADVRLYCELNAKEEQELTAPGAPIVLLKKRPENEVFVQSPRLAEGVAPNNPYLGVFLPNSPLHFLLLKLFGGALVVTSANLSEEPLVYSEPEVFSRLAGIADFYLVHNRPIARPIDDSVLQVIENQTFVLRGARGLSPLIIDQTLDGVNLAVGPHMKNTFALNLKKKLIVSQHMGDMESDLSQELFIREVDRYLKFYHLLPDHWVHDAHPSYFTSEWTIQKTIETNSVASEVQHHRAHVYAALAENNVEGTFLGVSWDGTGYGDDATIWGSEFFLADENHQDLKRVAHWRPFLLLGGESAVRSPWKVALALLFEADAELARRWFLKFHSDKELKTFLVLEKMWHQKINSPTCTSMGRFLEGVSAILGLVQENECEADAAIQLEFAAHGPWLNNLSKNPLGLSSWVKTEFAYQWDWRDWIVHAARVSLGEESGSITPTGNDIAEMALEIHLKLIESLFDMADLLKQSQLVIGGGVFQNRLLMTELLRQAKARGFKVAVPQRIPLNDGGIAAGQLMSLKNRHTKDSKSQGEM